MTPMAVIIPSVQILVPGAAMVRMVLSNSGDTLSFTFTAISISFGFMVGEAIVSIFAPSSSGILKLAMYDGPYNNWDPEEAHNQEIVKGILPAGCKDYIVLTLVSAENVKAADFNGKSDPYAKFAAIEQGKKIKIEKTSVESIARSSTKKATLNPFWNEAFIFPLAPNQKIDSEHTENTTMCMRMAVIDHDMIGSDDELGHLDFTIDCEKKSINLNNEATIALAEMKKSYHTTLTLAGVDTGTVDIEITYFSVYGSMDHTNSRTDTENAVGFLNGLVENQDVQS
eukprot:Pgem_evm2s13314